MAGKKLKLLLVEDHEEMRKLLVAWLEELGHEVSDAGTGAQGIGLAEGEGFDAAFVDYSLPDMSGVELMKALRGAGVPAVVLLTAYELGGEEVVRTLGFDAGLIKPVEIETLEEVLGRVCRE